MSWRRGLVAVGLVAWLCGIVAAFVLIWRYKTTPGAAAAAPARWPAASAIRPAPGLANIVMIAHPQCPCTRASMAELARLADDVRGRARIHVLLVRPDDSPAGFEDGAVAERARAIPGADVVVDPGGEAHRFGAAVSGTTLVYGADGELLFHGGLTTARGHEGRSPAHAEIVAKLAGGSGGRDHTATFGCSLEDPELAPR